MVHLSITLFGPFTAVWDGEEITGFKSQRVRALLAYLAVESDRMHSRDTLAALFWPDWSNREARNHLRYALYNLRQVIHDDQNATPHIIINREKIQFNQTSDYFLDINEFTRLLKGNKFRSPNPENLRRAIELYQGDFLEGFVLPDSLELDEWVMLKRTELERLRTSAWMELADFYETHGEFGQSLDCARRVVEFDPWHEHSHRQIIRLLAYTGERSSALLYYEQFRSQLNQELGVEPAEQTRELIAKIQDDHTPFRPPTENITIQKIQTSIGECPYRGLSAFREEDARFFFGRTEFVTKLLTRLERQQFVVVVVGASGSGKSSIIYAGLMPHLRQPANWMMLDFRPGQRPFQSLAAELVRHLELELSETDSLIEIQKMADALQQSRLSLQEIIERILERNPQVDHLLLFADQFEELYTLCPNETLRHQIVDSLLQTTQWAVFPAKVQIKILLTLRADFMGQALDYRPFADLLQGSMQLLGPMSLAELREAVQKPAEMQGVSFEVGLVERILEDVGDRPGNLPLLEFALTLLWEKVQDDVLTHAAYENIGRVEGALTHYAEKVYTSLPEREQCATRKIFMQLIQPGVGTEDFRRVTNRDEIGNENWLLVQHLADKRLIVTNRNPQGVQTAEVIHEALIQHWSRLREWLEDDRTFRLWQETLRSSIRQWQAANEDESGLLHGVLLSQAETWLAARGSELGEQEKQYILKSISLRQRAETEREKLHQLELEQAKSLAATERRARRNLSVLAVVLGIAVLVTTALVTYAKLQQRNALEAYSLSLAASAEQNLSDLDSGSALALALVANQINDSPIQSQKILMEAAYSPGARSREALHTLFPGTVGPATSMAISPVGDKVLMGFSGGQLVLWNPESGVYQILNGHTDSVKDVAISPNGLTALSGGADKQIIYWDLRTGTEIRKLGDDRITGIVRTVAFSPDGRLAVSGGLSSDSISYPGTLVLWDLESGQAIRHFVGHINGVVDAQFTPDGKKILSTSGDFELTIKGDSSESHNAVKDLLLWDTSSGTVVTRYENLSHDISAIAISPDGSQVLLASYYDNIIDLLDLNNALILSTLTGHENAVRAVAFLPNGRAALSASDDGSLIQWNLINGSAQRIFKAGVSAQIALVIDPSGHTAYSVTRGNDLFRWDLEDAAIIRRFGWQPDMVFDVAYSRDGKSALSCSGSPSPDVLPQEAGLRLWELSSGKLLRWMPTQALVNWTCAISPDGRQALSGDFNGLLHLWDLSTGQEVRKFDGYKDWVISLAFAPDGGKALAGSRDGILIYWDLESGQPIQTMDNGPNSNWSLAISPDGKTALSDAGSSGVTYWDLATGREITRLVRSDEPEIKGASGVAYLPDGKTAITGENDGNLIQWNLTTGQEIHRFGRHDDIRTRVEISRDGKLMLTSGMNGRLRLWNLITGDMIREFGYSEPAMVYDISMSPDSLTALSSSVDQMVTQWSLRTPSLDELRAWIAANRYVRELTCDERARYQIEPLCQGK